MAEILSKFQGSEFADITNWPTPGEISASSNPKDLKVISRLYLYTIHVPGGFVP